MVNPVAIKTEKRLTAAIDTQANLNIEPHLGNNVYMRRIEAIAITTNTRNVTDESIEAAATNHGFVTKKAPVATYSANANNTVAKIIIKNSI